MRLWHYRLIPVLPRQQLLGQYREVCAIAKSIAINKSPNHPLVNRVCGYPAYMFMGYQMSLEKEIISRGYSLTWSSRWALYDNTMLAEEEGYFADDDNFKFDLDILFPGWHNDRYLRQCYFNLQEKYDCGMISEEEWNKIESFVDKMNVMMYYV